ncbi:hypothetical protein VTL71DRAFT_6984 [Oculimacula yallundae]|uniref:Secreted peptide n=1 Tax=Oculimacula yallundae TaxID=86028 RepID=A0ABR4BW89_9HELO
MFLFGMALLLYIMYILFLVVFRAPSNRNALWPATLLWASLISSRPCFYHTASPIASQPRLLSSTSQNQELGLIFLTTSITHYHSIV